MVDLVVVPDEAIVAGISRLCIYGLVLVVGFRLRRFYHWPVGLALVFVFASNAALMRGHLFLSGVLAVPFAALNAWIYLRVMRDDSRALRALLGSKQAEWSAERHDLLNRALAAESRYEQLRRIYESPGS